MLGEFRHRQKNGFRRTFMYRVRKTDDSQKVTQLERELEDVKVNHHMVDGLLVEANYR